jgi:hypothetical protein
MTADEREFWKTVFLTILASGEGSDDAAEAADYAVGLLRAAGQPSRTEVFDIKGPDEWPGLVRAAGLSGAAYLGFGKYGKVEIGVRSDATIFGRLRRLRRVDGGDDAHVVGADEDADDERGDED